MNATTQAIIDRLPGKPLVSPQEIADAFALATSQSIVQDIVAGKCGAVKIGNRYIVHIDEAKRYVISKEVIPTEGTLPHE